MAHEDHTEYYGFTRRARLDKAIHTLEGIVDGITADGGVDNEEVQALREWLIEHGEFADRHPFNEIIPVLNVILKDGVVDAEERADLLWLCRRFTNQGGYYDAVTSDMQHLQGMLAGIAANQRILESELDSLDEWMQEHRHLLLCWPYAELESLIAHVMKDGKIDEREHSQLMNFFADFSKVSNHQAIDCKYDPTLTISGVCAFAPDIHFVDRKFCFTGASAKGTKRELAAIVENGRGIHCKNVVRDLSYLVVGSEGNPCWAFAAYGRKVEAVVEFRKKGSQTLIISEIDFWDAARDEGLAD